MKNRPPAKCGGFEPVSNVFFCEKNPAKNPIDRIGTPSFCKNFQRMAVIARSRDFDSRPSGPLRRSMGQIHAGLGPFEPKGPISPMVFLFLWKNTLRPIFSLLIETIGSQVVGSMFTCSRRPPIFDLPGCHARFELPRCQ